MREPYVCVATRLRIRGIRVLPAFLWLSFRSAWVARRTPGNVRTRLLALPPVFLTLTVWRSEEAMRVFVRHEVHRAAMARMDEVAAGGMYARFTARTRWVGWLTAFRRLRGPDAVRRTPTVRAAG